MAYEQAKIASAYFDSENLKHEVLGDHGEVIRTGFSGRDNVGQIEIYIFFDEEATAHFQTAGYVHVPKDKIEKMCIVLNGLNRQYRWTKFTVSEEGDIEAEADGVLDLDTCGDESLEIILRLAHICDEAYPTIMKAVYGD